MMWIVLLPGSCCVMCRAYPFSVSGVCSMWCCPLLPNGLFRAIRIPPFVDSGEFFRCGVFDMCTV